MDSRYNWGENKYGGAGSYDYRPGMIQSYDYANWGYIILYIIVILLSLFGNLLFLFTIKKNTLLQKTPHFLLATLSIRDLIVTLGVIPFVIDSQAVNYMHWKAGEALCKGYSFMNYGTMAQHSFNIVFLMYFLYFWYRKQESYATTDGNIIRRETKMHKWSIPLMWVIGISLAIPAGALAWQNINPVNGSRMCVLWPGYGSGNNYWAKLSVVIGGFLIPLIFIIFPALALAMQVFKCREPRLDPPHNRTAATGVALVFILIVTRFPYEIHQMVGLFNQGRIGDRMDPQWSSMQSNTNFEKEMIFNALIYIAPAIHPFVYFLMNPLYRDCLKKTWKAGLCSKDSTEGQQDNGNKERMKEMKSIPPQRNRAPQDMRSKEEPLVDRRHPVIIPAVSGSSGYYNARQHHPPTQHQHPHHQQTHHHHTHHPLKSHYDGNLSFEERQTMRAIADQNHFPLDNSFENHSIMTTSPNSNLPPVFEFEGLKYIDTARVEPRIAYSPEKTPPKTPDTPRYDQKPFADPVERFIQNNAWAHYPMEMVDFSIPPTLPESPMLIRSQSRVNDLDETLEVLEESPGSKKRNRNFNSSKEEFILSNGRPKKNQIKKPLTSPENQLLSRASGIEIKISGRSRSRTDLCPDIPRSKFEHCV
ncbi:uncharacterized protein [Lepeophtheirus salmonis]|uniref:uncharacterized protein isoform X1 n=2 Tax=Lepeophtheirus salmonis TaxID=72036 RepID=UPI001AE6B480|nr:somatostatin receptor type 2-like isoform X1 [Lepeophtheirus salmonis]